MDSKPLLGKYNSSTVYPDWVARLYDESRLYFAYFFKRKKLTEKHPSFEWSPFFIIGSGRSGNTLLRAILANHTDVSIPPESYVLGNIIRRFRVLNFLDWNEICRIVISMFEDFKLFENWELDAQLFYKQAIQFDDQNKNLASLIHAFYMYYASIKKPSAVRWGDKTPINTFHLFRLQKVFPDAKFIHIIRDGRDVVSSYLQSGFYQDPSAAAKRWLVSLELAQKFGKKNKPKHYCEIRYENMVKNPHSEIREICNFIDLTYTDQMLDFHENIDKMGDTKLSHHRNLKNPINSASIGKWEKNLSDSEHTLVMKIIQKKLGALSYI